MLSAFEADGLHIAEAVLRMLDGEVQHVDYHTPLGILAFLPTELLMQAGLGFGEAAAYSNLAVAVGFLPVLIWVGLSRFRGASGYGFAAVTILLFVSLTLGGNTFGGIDIALYYNRWCWAVSGLVFAIVMLEGPESAKSHMLDGIFIGLCLSFLAMTKITYFIFLAPPVFLGLVLFQRFLALGVALVSGILVLAGIVVWTGGPGFLMAYVSDLSSVAESGARAAPSLGLVGVMLSPPLLVGNIALIAAGIVLRRAGFLREGLFVLMLVPFILLVVVQNWGNYPQWALALSMILFAIAVQDRSRRRTGAIRVTALVLAVVAFPQVMTMALSLLAEKVSLQGQYVTVLQDPRFADVKFLRSRQAMTMAMVTRPFGYGPQYDADAMTGGGTFRGEALPRCELHTGLPAYIRAIADDLAARPDTRGKRILSASNASNYWMFGGTKRLRDAEIWYYGNDRGFEDADFLVIPLCTYGTQGLNSRQIIIDKIDEDGRYKFTEVARNDLYILLRRER